MPTIDLQSTEKEKSFISSEDREVDSSTQKQRNSAAIDGYQIAGKAEKGLESNVYLASTEDVAELSGSMDLRNDSGHEVSCVATLSGNLELLSVRGDHVVSLSGFEERFFEAISTGDLILTQSYLENKYITSQTLLKVCIFEGKSYTPLELAIQYGHLDILNLLLCSEKCTEEVVGCRIDKDKDISILNYALNLNQAEACRLILKGPQFKHEHFLFKPFCESKEFEEHSYCSLALDSGAYDILQVFIDELAPEALKEALLDKENISESCLFQLTSIIEYPLIDSPSTILKLKDCLLQIYRILCCCKQDLEAQQAQAYILRSVIFDYRDFEFLNRILSLDEFHVSVLSVQIEKSCSILWRIMDKEKIGKRILSLPEISPDLFLQVDLGYGRTPLHQAVKSRQQELVKMYLSPESVIKNFPKEAVFISDALGNSILHSAIENKDIPMIDILLSSNYGKQLLKMSNTDGQTPRDYLDALMSFKIGEYSTQGYESRKSKIERLESKCAELSSEINNMEQTYSTDVLDWNKHYAFLKRRLNGYNHMIGEIQIELGSWAQLQEEESLVLKKIQEKIIHYSNE